MGVGAVFIASLASDNLPVPQSPPENQTEFLAASVQPIVAFVVLCSIVTRESPPLLAPPIVANLFSL